MEGRSTGTGWTPHSVGSKEGRGVNTSVSRRSGKVTAPRMEYLSCLWSRYFGQVQILVDPTLRRGNKFRKVIPGRQGNDTYPETPQGEKLPPVSGTHV